MAKEHENFDHKSVKLGKLPYKHDDRTLMLARFVLPTVHIPARYDFDSQRTAFPTNLWGNDDYGDCVIAAESNQLVRLERIEQRKTIGLTDAAAITRYKLLTGCQSPGDANDTGLVMLDAFRDWRKKGYAFGKHQYEIAAYGELNTKNGRELRTAAYLLHGIHFGVALPAAAQQMTQSGVWDYNGETGDEWEPGSWGGHAVFSKAFDVEDIEIITWGMKVKMTDSFVSKYADEAWAVVDSLDSWTRKQTFDVVALEKELSKITSQVDQ